MKKIILFFVIGLFLIGNNAVAQGRKESKKKDTSKVDKTSSSPSDLQKYKKENSTLKSNNQSLENENIRLKADSAAISNTLYLLRDSLTNSKPDTTKLTNTGTENDDTTFTDKIENYFNIIIGLATAFVISLVLLIWLWLKTNKKAKNQEKTIPENILIATLQDRLKNFDYLENDVEKLNTHNSNNGAEKPELIDPIEFLKRVLETISNHQNTTNKESDNWGKIYGVVKYSFPHLVSPNEIISTTKEAVTEYAASFNKEPKVPIQKEATPQEQYQFKSDGEPESGIKSGSSNSNFINEDPIPAGPRFYFNNPVKSGSFIDEQKTPSRSPETLFEFSLNNDNPTEASYYLSPSPDAIPSALNFYTIKIEPVCDIENAQEPYHKSIRHIKAGRARLEDGKWIIIHRAKAKFV